MPRMLKLRFDWYITKSNGGFFYLCLLPLGLRDDSEVEINDILGKTLNIFVPSSRVELFTLFTRAVMLTFHVAHMYFRTVH